MADERTKVNAAIEQLKRLGYSYNDDAQAIIEQCDLWYTASGTMTAPAVMCRAT